VLRWPLAVLVLELVVVAAVLVREVLLHPWLWQ
jgi:hypothetical protein